MSTQGDRNTALGAAALESGFKPSFLLLIYLNAFVVGAVVMGFEMLGSRYLNPLFGSGIYTWAALISTVLASLTLGYFFGGWVADRYPKPAGLGWLIVLGSAYLALIPLFAEDLLELLSTLLGGIEDQREYERWGSILGAMLLLFVPLALLGVYSPYAIRLTLTATANSGTVAGRIYGISTLGSIFGTLFTTFYLIPAMGSRNITYLLSAIGIAAGLCFVLARPAGVVRALSSACVLLLAAAAVAPGESRAQTAPERAVPAQASGNEAADRFVAYLRRNRFEVSHGTVGAGPGGSGFRIEALKLVGRARDVWQVGAVEAARFEARDTGEATATDLVLTDLRVTGPDKTVIGIRRVAVESLQWTVLPGEPAVALRGLAAREIDVADIRGESVRVATLDVARFRAARQAGEIEKLAARTVTFAGETPAAESGSMGAFDIESVTVSVPERIAASNVAIRDLLVAVDKGASTIRLAAAELHALDVRGLQQSYPAELRALRYAITGLDVPVGNRHGADRELRALGYTQIRLNTEFAFAYDAATKTYDLAKLEIDVADAARLTLGLKIAGPSPAEIRKALEPPPAPTPPPGAPGTPPRRDNMAAFGLLAQFNLASADLSYADKSLLSRLILREATRQQNDEAAIRARYRGILIALRDGQNDPALREMLESVIAFFDAPGELILEVRPPTPFSIVALGTLFATNPAQIIASLGVKLTVRKP